jgi:hypothetical protein
LHLAEEIKERGIFSDLGKGEFYSGEHKQEINVSL